MLLGKLLNREIDLALAGPKTECIGGLRATHAVLWLWLLDLERWLLGGMPLNNGGSLALHLLVLALGGAHHAAFSLTLAL